MEIMNQAVLTGHIKKKRLSTSKLIAILFVLVGIGAAFFFSAQPASISKLQSGDVLNIFNSFGLNVSMHFVRKLAHFVLFGTIGATFTFLFQFKLSGIKLFTSSFMAATLMAIIDETHQIFVPGRGPQVKDVLIDASGAFVAVLIFATIITIYKRKKALT